MPAHKGDALLTIRTPGALSAHEVAGIAAWLRLMADELVRNSGTLPAAKNKRFRYSAVVDTVATPT